MAMRVTLRMAACGSGIVLAVSLAAATATQSRADETPGAFCVARFEKAVPPGFSISPSGEGFLIGREGARATASLKVGSGGSLLNVADYAKKRSAATEDQRRRDFPEIGARAMISAMTVGPGGASVTLVSTTLDERCDLAVTVTDAGDAPPGDVLDPYDLSAELQRRYAAEPKQP